MSSISETGLDSPPSQSENKHNEFICGVVEGFYGRPWTTDQRKDLFIKLQKWGMNSYLYAPKDDCKHRVYWRELYSVEEAEHLTALIDTAKEHNITFYYALSPGLDITYSSTKEVSNLKRKLDQVAQFGCHAFALLFDDILAEMCEADKEVFQSFSHAQVSLTNEIYQHLGQPRFLFCPTLYCGYRAIPDVKNSEYLQTLGSKLDLGINVMWTGSKVISKLISLESIEELTDVLHRPPVIWDNLHANDYDQKRVFLGPYSGRSPNLIPHLRGVLTNPNCEYETNFIGIHTLAQWSTCVGDTNCLANGSLSADIKLETETEDGRIDYEPSTLGPKVYHPKRALRIAIREWNKEYYRTKSAWTSLARRQFQVIAPMPILPTINPTLNPGLCPPVQAAPELALNPVITSVEMPPNLAVPFHTIPVAPVMNSLVAENKVVISSVKLDPSSAPTSVSEIESPSVKDIEPMDYHPVVTNVTEIVPAESQQEDENKMVVENGLNEPTPSNSETAQTISEVVESTNLTTNNINNEVSGENACFYPNSDNGKVKAPMEIETDIQENIADESKSNTDGSMVVEQVDPDNLLTVEDLSFLVDLFYLPFEHGAQGVQLLQEFNWLKLSSYVLKEAKSNENPPEVEEWYNRAEKFKQCARHLEDISLKLVKCPNKSLLYDLYPYVWDIQGVVSLMCSYISWLATFRGLHQSNVTYVTGLHTWFAKGWKEAFMSGEQEPWVFRGGLTGELQRLIPVDSPNDLFAYKVPEAPISKVYSIRPYASSDESQVYEICRMTSGSDGTAIPSCFSVYPNLVPDKLIGGFLTLYPELCFVVDDGTEVLGYCVACSDVKQFYGQLKISWIPELQTKYPKLEGDPANLGPVEMEIMTLYDEMLDIPFSVSSHHSAEVRVSVLPSVLDPSVPKRLVTCLLSALRSNGTFGAFAQLHACDKFFIDFYSKLAFMEINLGEEKAMTDKIFLGRTF